MTRADAGEGRKRVTQRERAAAAIHDALGFIANTPLGESMIGAAADAAIAAMPDPYVKKERDRPKLPTDDCVLCAMRLEFVALVGFIEANADEPGAEGPLALAEVLRKQGVV